MKKVIILTSVIFFFSQITLAQYSLGVEGKYHPDVYQISARYDNLTQLNSSFNAGLRYNFHDYKGIGLFVGYNYHARNTFKTGFTFGSTLNLDFVDQDEDNSTKKPVFTLELNAGYQAFYGKTNRLIGWYQLHAGYSFNNSKDEDDENKEGSKEKDGPFETLRVMPGITLGYKF
ncbi:MAG: hypothetical protein KDF60_20275 [Calditrichaeota bacterium]|nr:hypothetical protein [Calditrichota bacterium]